MRLLELLRADAPSLPALRDHLDALAPTARTAEVLELDRAAQARLFELAAGVRPMTLEDLVPGSTAAMQGVVHEGRNSLPAFSRFAKVFYRPDDGALAKGEVWGFNRTSRLVTTAVGPGYFTTRPHGVGELLVDYTRAPGRFPADGPAYLPNSARLSRFVYHQTQDVLRGVSAHVCIGRASRSGQDLDNWFVLCRVA